MAWFFELSGARADGFNGPAAITFPDIESWSRLTARRLSRFEIELLLAVDKEFRAAAARQQQRTTINRRAGIQL